MSEKREREEKEEKEGEKKILHWADGLMMKLQTGFPLHYEDDSYYAPEQCEKDKARIDVRDFRATEMRLFNKTCQEIVNSDETPEKKAKAVVILAKKTAQNFKNSLIDSIEYPTLFHATASWLWIIYCESGPLKHIYETCKLGKGEFPKMTRCEEMMEGILYDSYTDDELAKILCPANYQWLGKDTHNVENGKNDRWATKEQRKPWKDASNAKYTPDRWVDSYYALLYPSRMQDNLPKEAYFMICDEILTLF